MGAGQIQRRAPGPLRGRAGAALAALLGLAWTLGLPLPPVGLLGPLGRVPAAHASHPTFAVLTTAGRGGSTELRAFARDGGLIGGLSPYGSFSGGSYVASADVSGDGHADIITGAGAGGGPHVIIFDGVTGSPIRSFFAYPTNFTGGAFVAAGDVDGDGKADIITGAGAGGTPHVKVFDVSGQNIKEIRSFQAYGQGFTGGVRVAAGFVTPDNRADIITGAGPGGGPHVKVFDGNTGGELGGLLAYGGFTGGVYVASGDLNGDRLADIITGPGPGGGPHVKAFSGLNGAEMRNFFAYDAGFTGGVFVGGGDVTGDGRADIIAGAGPGGGPHVRVFDGASAAEARSFFAYDGGTAGVRVAGNPIGQAPLLEITGGPGEGTTVNTPTPTYTGRAADADGFVERVQVKIDGGSFSILGVTCTGCGTPGATWSFTPTTALAPGPHALAFRAKDNGDVSSPEVVRNVIIQAPPGTAPTLAVTGGPVDGGTSLSATPTYSGTAADSDGTVEAVEVEVDGSSFRSVGVTCTGCGTASATWSFTPVAALTGGPHVLKFRAKDNVFAVSAEVIRNVTIQSNTAGGSPTIQLTSGPADGAQDTTGGLPTYTGIASDDVMVVKVQVKDRFGQQGNFTQQGVTCSGCSTPSVNWSWTPTTPLLSGTHTISFRSVDNDLSTDPGGNKSPEVQSTLIVP